MKSCAYSLMLMIFCGFSAALAAEPVVWNGTADTKWYNENETEFTINTAEELAGLAELVNEGNSFKDKIVALGTDIMLNDTTGWELWDEDTENLKMWMPIGTFYIVGNVRHTVAFEGIFNGNGHKISGLYINITDDYQGLFFGNPSVGKCAYVNNLGVLASWIKGGDYTGGIATCGNISNSYFIGVVKGLNRVGGIIGSGSVSNSHFIGTVEGNDYVGGLLGSGGNATNSYSTGVVNGTGSNVGGIAGYNEKTISDSYSTSTVKGKISVGGIVGYNNIGFVSNCHYSGDVIGNDVPGIGYYTGGIVGRNDGGNYGGRVSNSYSSGTVIGSSSVGGIVGANEFLGSILNSFSSSNVTGNYGVGGIAGGSGYNGAGAVANNYSTGTIMGNRIVGGIVGVNYDGMVINNYSISTVNGTGNMIGGIAGTISGGGTIANNYFSGVVDGIDSVGGIAGNNYRGKVFDSYWNETFNGGMDGVPYGAIGEENISNLIGMTDTEMKNIQFVETLNTFVDSINTAQKSITYLSWFLGANDFNKGYPAFAYRITDVAVTLAANSYIYDGNAKTPAVTVKLDNTVLTENSDYTVSYANNIDVGNATINIAGIGSYSGIKTAAFSITKKMPTEADLDFAIPANHIYNGSAQGIGTVAVKSPMTGIGIITVKYNGSTTAPTDVGTYAVTVDIAEGTNFEASTGISLGTYIIEEEPKETNIVQKPALASNISILVYAQHFQVQGIAKAEKMQLLDLKGNILLNKSVQPNEIISIAHLPRGVYLVNIGNKTFK